MKVLLIESGYKSYRSEVQSLSEAAEWDPERHASMTMAVRRQIGGTSTIWGGRCVPFDPVDFDTRSFVGSASWPVTYEEMARYFQRACDWFVCGRAVFDARRLPNAPLSIVPGLVEGDITGSALERWSLPTDFGRTYLRELQTSRNVRLLTGLTAIQIDCPSEGSTARSIKARTETGVEVLIEGKAFVVACGGLESTRLLMCSRGPEGGQLGASSGHLGRWYMAHNEGVVANFRFSTAPRSTLFGYERDVDGVYVRRRLGFAREFQKINELPNIAAWITNPALPNASHESGQLSFIYLALRSRLGKRLAPEPIRLSLLGEYIPGTPNSGATASPNLRHIRNILHEPLTTARFIADFGTKRILARHRRVPGYAIYNKDNVYPMQFHGEHLPNASSQVSLSSRTDQLGRRKLNIDIRFSNADIEGLVRAHKYWDSYLRSLGIGELQYLEADTYNAVKRQLGGGFHQIGTTRMSADPTKGVVDENLAIHGVKNVFVASSSTFVTSGQANSTFMIVAFAIRLADHLRRTLG